MVFQQEARKINAALHQVITYKEYLPAVLSESMLRRENLAVPTNGFKYVIWKWQMTILKTPISIAYGALTDIRIALIF